MGDFDDLLSCRGVILVVEFGPSWEIVRHAEGHMVITLPGFMDRAQWLCGAVSQMFNAMTFAVDGMTGHGTGFDQSSWSPWQTWSLTGHDYSVLASVRHAVFFSTKDCENPDELSRRLAELDSSK